MAGSKAGHDTEEIKMSTTTQTAPETTTTEVTKAPAPKRTRKAPATTTAKAPAKKAAPAEAPEAKTEATTKKPSIRWSYEGDRGEKSAQVGTSPFGTYRISPSGEKWMVTVERANGKQTTLAEGISHGGAYAKAVSDFKEHAAK
jgi:hypothetical protein